MWRTIQPNFVNYSREILKSAIHIHYRQGHDSVSPCQGYIHSRYDVMLHIATVNVIAYAESIIEIWSTLLHTNPLFGLIFILYLLDILCSFLRMKMYLFVHQWSYTSVFLLFYVLPVIYIAVWYRRIPIYSLITLTPDVQPNNTRFHWRSFQRFCLLIKCKTKVNIYREKNAEKYLHLSASQY